MAPTVRSPNLVTIRPIQNSLVPESNGTAWVDSIERFLPRARQICAQRYRFKWVGRDVKIYTGFAVQVGRRAGPAFTPERVSA